MKTYKEFINEAIGPVDTKKARMNKILKKDSKGMRFTTRREYSYKEAQADFKKSYGKDAGEVLWDNGHWLDSNIGEVLKAKEKSKPAGVKAYKK